MASNSYCGLAGIITERAGVTLRGQAKVRAADTGDERITEGVSWHSIAGKKWEESKRITKCIDFKINTASLCVVLERVREATAFFLQCSKSRKDPCRSMAQDCVNPKRASPRT